MNLTAEDNYDVKHPAYVNGASGKEKTDKMILDSLIIQNIYTYPILMKK